MSQHAGITNDDTLARDDAISAQMNLKKIEVHFSAARREIRKAEKERSRKHLPIGIFLFSSLKSTIIA